MREQVTPKGRERSAFRALPPPPKRGFTRKRMNKKIKALSKLADINAYTEDAASRKSDLHRIGKAFLRGLAEDIGLEKGSFDVRSNLGGMAVSGEVTLHGESIYIQLSESCMHRGVSAMYRTCDGHKDYSGGRNNFVKLSDLADPERYDRFVRECKDMCQSNELTPSFNS